MDYIPQKRDVYYKPDNKCHYMVYVNIRYGLVNLDKGTVLKGEAKIEDIINCIKNCNMVKVENYFNKQEDESGLY